MNVHLDMLTKRIPGMRCALSVLFCVSIVGLLRSQDYVSEPRMGLENPHQWEVGWDVSRLLKGQAVGTVQHWFHPEFSLMVSGGMLVSNPWHGVPGLGVEMATGQIESGGAMGLGVRFHPQPVQASKMRTFIGFEVNRDRYEIVDLSVRNTWIHQEWSALLGATKSCGEHWAITGHVAVNSTQDLFALRTVSTGVKSMAAPGRVAGLQLAYRW